MGREACRQFHPQLNDFSARTLLFPARALPSLPAQPKRHANRLGRARGVKQEIPAVSLPNAATCAA